MHTLYGHKAYSWDSKAWQVLSIELYFKSQLLLTAIAPPLHGIKLREQKIILDKTDCAYVKVLDFHLHFPYFVCDLPPKSKT